MRVALLILFVGGISSLIGCGLAELFSDVPREAVVYEPSADILEKVTPEMAFQKLKQWEESAVGEKHFIPAVGLMKVTTEGFYWYDPRAEGKITDFLRESTFIPYSKINSVVIWQQGSVFDVVLALEGASKECFIRVHGGHERQQGLSRAKSLVDAFYVLSRGK